MAKKVKTVHDSETKHPKTEAPKKSQAKKAPVEKVEEAPVRRSFDPQAELEVTLAVVGGAATVSRRVAQVTYGNPTNMAAVLRELRDELETHY